MLSDNNSSVNIVFARHEFVLDAAGALYWPAYQCLVIADLHLEKGSYFADRQQFLPLYDTHDTLQRIEKLIQLYQPERIICLGDNFHDKNALLRMHKTDFDYLIRLHDSINEWIWIIGNHDGNDYAASSLAHMSFKMDYQLEDVTFIHEFIDNEYLQIGGHFHPKSSISVNNNRLSGKCFLVSKNKIVMPAFGTYTGGLNASDPVFEKTLKTNEFKCYLFNKNVIKRVK